MSIICIGVDQSYEDTGIAIVLDGKVKLVTDVKLKGYKNNRERRRALGDILHSAIKTAKGKSKELGCPCRLVFERIRLRSAGVLSFDYIKSMGALCAVISDLCVDMDVPVYSADTRAWKTAVVGTAKPQDNTYGIDPKKWPTICWCNEHGYGRHIRDYEISPRKKKGVFQDMRGERYVYNDNKADAICIALYGCMPDAKLQEER